MVFKHEDLVLRLESVMQNTANFLEIKYNDGLLRPTWGGLTWMTTYYNFDSKNNVANPDILSKSWIKEESKNEIYVIEGICHAVINKYYDGGLYFKQDNLISLFKLIVKCLIPTNTEKKHIVDLLKLHQYFSIISHETKNIYDLKSYSNNLYYSLKWTNDGCDYSSLKTDTLLRFINNSSTLNLSKISILYRLIFFISRIISYIFVIIFIPLNIIFKILTCYKAIFRRFRKKSYLPDAL